MVCRNSGSSTSISVCGQEQEQEQKQEQEQRQEQDVEQEQEKENGSSSHSSPNQQVGVHPLPFPFDAFSSLILLRPPPLISIPYSLYFLPPFPLHCNSLSLFSLHFLPPPSLPFPIFLFLINIPCPLSIPPFLYPFHSPYPFLPYLFPIPSFPPPIPHHSPFFHTPPPLSSFIHSLFFLTFPSLSFLNQPPLSPFHSTLPLLFPFPLPFSSLFFPHTLIPPSHPSPFSFSTYPRPFHIFNYFPFLIHPQLSLYYFP